MRNIFLIDLPNLYNQICRVKEIENPKDYFLNWLKLDNLAYAVVGEENRPEGLE